MAASRHIDKICFAAIASALIIALLLMIFAPTADSEGTYQSYEDGLFDTSVVHTIDISMDDWDDFIAGCEDEEYVACDVTVDGTVYRNVAIRAKGNTSLSNVSQLGSSRYSFKLEFDHYDSGISCDGLDKLSLNNIIQDDTYLKDYICYRMMYEYGVDAPLCSFAYITVNGEDWGLYLAVEGVEESFLARNYGSSTGELYKPDSSDMGGGKGNGRGFEQGDMSFDGPTTDGSENARSTDGGAPAVPTGGETPMDDQAPEMPTGGEMPNMSDMPETPTDGEMQQAPSDGGMPSGGRGDMNGGGTQSSDDVLLRYTDDSFDSYSNIFDNAKTDITDEDKTRLIASLKKLGENEDIESVVDIDEVLRYFVVHNFVCSFDSYTGSMVHNYYLYEQDGQLSMIPWDYNLAFGGFQSAADATSLVNYPIDDPTSGSDKSERPMLAWIFASEEYTEQYHEYMQEFIDEMFTSGRFAEIIDEVVELISPYVEKDPTKFCTYDEFVEAAATLKEFCFLRAESVSGQLDGAIPSTEEGQTADSSALVDASALSIDKMGGMGNTTEGDAGGRPDIQADQGRGNPPA